MRPLIFISNDDGVHAKGLNELVAWVKDMADVVVMAPDGPRSGSAAAITSIVPVTYKKVSEEPGVSIYSCSGTPVDCVKLAFETVLPRRPDLVLSGINHGDNASVNVHYSGTMGVVFEGCLKGIPSIGFSLADACADADFTALQPCIRTLVSQILAEGLPQGVCLNVNFPAGKNLRGLRVCRMGWGCWNCEWKSAAHPAGKPTYWLTGQYENLEPDATDTDVWALSQGYASVVPIRLDVTAYDCLENMKTKLEEIS